MTLAIFVSLAAGFTPHASVHVSPHARATIRSPVSSIVLKKTAEDVEGYSIDTSSIVEFHDPNKKECILGIVESCEARAKGGAKVSQSRPSSS